MIDIKKDAIKPSTCTVCVKAGVAACKGKEISLDKPAARIISQLRGEG